MPYPCKVCGKTHRDLPKFFEWSRPADYYDLEETERDTFVEVNEHMCHIADQRHFIKCELEVPFKDRRRGVMGFITWVGVTRNNFYNYLEFRENEDNEPDPPPLLPGWFCGLIPEYENALWSPVFFAVIKGDPIPYIKITDEENPLFELVQQGATVEYWHTVAGLLNAG